jgi:hypothetical protein
MTFDSDGKDRVSIAQAINLFITVPHVGESWRQGSSNDEMFQRWCESGFPINFYYATFFYALLWGPKLRCNALILRMRRTYVPGLQDNSF